MRFLTYLIICHLCSLSLIGQEPLAQQVDFNLALISNQQIDFGSDTDDQYRRYADVWGYEQDGIEYAILGTGIGTAIYGLDDPAQPSLLKIVPGAPSRWRDYKSYGEYIYGVADEGKDGLLIINMSKAPDEITWTFWKPSLSVAGENLKTLEKCHNLFIDSTFVYLAGCNIYGGGVVIFDLAQNPQTPTLIGNGDRKYAHDVYAQGDRMYTSDLSQGFAIVDISDRERPNTLVTMETSRDFTHNAWASPDHHYLFTTDERSGATIDVYDIANTDEIKLLDQYRPTATLRNPVIPHNVHYLDGYLVTSYYTDGVKIIDAHEPDNLVEVGSFDTHTFRDEGFHGAWGAYPFLPSGLMLVSDIESGLYILDPDYKRASYIQGTCFDTITNSALSDVKIQVLSDKPGLSQSENDGRFKMGWSGEGRVDLLFSKSGYHSKMVSAMVTRGQYITIDVRLLPLNTINLSGTVIDSISGNPMQGAEVIAYNDTYEARTMSNAQGRFMLSVFEGTYTLAAGKWSFEHDFVLAEFSEDKSEIKLSLKPGYRDDFVFDYGWQVMNSTGTSTNQGWQRGIPKYSIYNSEFANPNGDVEGDFGRECFVTGLVGRLGGNLSDTSVLLSPIFDLSSYADPYINYATWFYDMGQSASDDNLMIYLGDGDKEILIEELNDSRSGWRKKSEIRVTDFIPVGKTMYLKLVAADRGSVHIYEAGIDAFFVSEGQTTAVSVPMDKLNMRVSPNPFNSKVILHNESRPFDYVEIFDLFGKKIFDKKNPTSSEQEIDLSYLRPGVYVLRVKLHDGTTGVVKIVKSDR